MCTNTTLFKDSNAEDMQNLFRFLTEVGVEGIMLSTGYPYTSINKRDIFMARQQSIEMFRKVLDTSKKYRFYSNPLYLSFLRGERNYACITWTSPAYTPFGWREPCYLIADQHTDSLDDLMLDKLWEKYGFGKDPRCARVRCTGASRPGSSRKCSPSRAS